MVDRADDFRDAAAGKKVETLGRLIDSAREIAASMREGEVLIYMLDLARSEVQVIADRS